MYSVFRAVLPLPEDDAVRAALVRSALDAVESVPGLTVRGWYDVAGFRADADLMVWWWAPEAAAVQEAYHRLRGSELGAEIGRASRRDRVSTTADVVPPR